MLRRSPRRSFGFSCRAPFEGHSPCWTAARAGAVGEVAPVPSGGPWCRPNGRWSGRGPPWFRAGALRWRKESRLDALLERRRRGAGSADMLARPIPSPMTSPPSPPLARYRQKRNFALTSEPAGTPDARGAVTKDVRALSFVVQKHWASRLHYDFRLELDGVLLSWAVPKGPSYDPSKMQMAIHVEDHPLDYASFEGTIPPRQYGAGTVIVWDRGTWEPEGDPRDGMAKGKLVFRLHGEKLAGLWELVRIAKPGDKQDAWMLFKKKDAWARPIAEYDVITALPDSVVARPLGPVEEREPRGAPASALAASAATATDVDLAAAVRAPLPA